jgi:hypothetical protein
MGHAACHSGSVAANHPLQTGFLSQKFAHVSGSLGGKKKPKFPFLFVTPVNVKLFYHISTSSATHGVIAPLIPLPCKKPRSVNRLCVLAHPQFSPTGIARRGERWMRNPGGKGLPRVHPAPFREGRRDRRAAEKPQLKPACSKEEPPPWSSKESPSPPGPALRAKLGVGKALPTRHRRPRSWGPPQMGSGTSMQRGLIPSKTRTLKR